MFMWSCPAMQRGEISLGYIVVAFNSAVATLLFDVYLNTYLEFAYLLWKDGASAAAGRTVNTSQQTVYKVVQRFLVNGSAFVQRKFEPIGRLNYNAGYPLNHYPEFSKLFWNFLNH